MLEKYYTKEQLDSIDERYAEERGEQYAKAWTEVFVGLEALRTANVEAEDEQTKPFAVMAQQLVHDFTQQDKAIESNINNMVDQEGGAAMFRSHGLPVSDELFDYYERAIQVHVKKN